MAEKKYQDLEKSLTNSVHESASITATVPHFTSLMDQYHARSLDEYNSCDLKITDVKGRKIMMAFMLKKYSPLKNTFNKEILRMMESGELSQILKKHAKKVPACVINRQMSLGFENITSAFLVILLGVIIGLVICFIEKFSET